MLRVVPFLLLCVTFVSGQELKPPRVVLSDDQTLVASIETKDGKTVLKVEETNKFSIVKTLKVEEKSPSLFRGEFSKDNSLLGVILRSGPSTRIVLYDFQAGKRLWTRDEPGASSFFFEEDHIVILITEAKTLKTLKVSDGSTISTVK